MEACRSEPSIFSHFSPYSWNFFTFLKAGSVFQIGWCLLCVLTSVKDYLFCLSPIVSQWLWRPCCFASYWQKNESLKNTLLRWILGLNTIKFAEKMHLGLSSWITWRSITKGALPWVGIQHFQMVDSRRSVHLLVDGAPYHVLCQTKCFDSLLRG